MKDLIRRQATIDAIQKLNIPEDMCVFEIMSHIEVEIATLPSAQPKRGKWIERNPLNSNKCRLIECDQCGNSYIVGFNVPYEHWIDNRNYCEKCGADMRGEQNE